MVVENIVGKGKNAGNQHFLLFPQCFQQPSSMNFELFVSRFVICRCFQFNPLPDNKILDRSKLKQSADDNSRFDENSRKFSKRVENNVGKGEIAHYEQFLLFPQCFHKACFLEASKSVIVWEWVKGSEMCSGKRLIK